jgi:hypothetical protein
VQQKVCDVYLKNIDKQTAFLFRPNALPIAGADAVDYIIGLKDTGYSMQWKPSNAVVAVSGDLGYTYGVYEIKSFVVDTTLYGTYVSIWKNRTTVNGNYTAYNNEGNRVTENKFYFKSVLIF